MLVLHMGVAISRIWAWLYLAYSTHLNIMLVACTMFDKRHSNQVVVSVVATVLRYITRIPSLLTICAKPGFHLCLKRCLRHVWGACDTYFLLCLAQNTSGNMYHRHLRHVSGTFKAQVETRFYRNLNRQFNGHSEFSPDLFSMALRHLIYMDIPWKEKSQCILRASVKPILTVD